jgi:hypothetical protein
MRIRFEGAGEKKVDNKPEARRAKINVRQKVLDVIGRKARVFDAFAGSGDMYSAVWKNAGHYIGCDLKLQADSRLMFCADNTRVMRAIDLSRFSIFDFDSYGSPWVQAVILADRRRVAPGELLGLVLTEGLGVAYNGNQVPHAIALLTGVRKGMVGMSKKRDAMMDRAIAGLARRMNCTVEKRWQAEGRTGAAMRYIGLVLKGKG